MKTKTISLFLGALALGAPGIATAQDNPLLGEFSGNVSVGTDYVFRGYSQTLEEPTVQGGLD